MAGPDRPARRRQGRPRQTAPRPRQAATRPHPAGFAALPAPVRVPAEPSGQLLPPGLRARRPAPVPVPAGTRPTRAPDGDGAREPAHELPEVLRPAVTVTCWADPGDSGQPYDAVIMFSGRRAAPASAAPGACRFERQETVRLVPGSGPVAVTTRAEDVTAGDWLVRARPDRPDGRLRMLDPDARPAWPRPRPGARSLRGKGNPVAPGASAHASTRAAAFAVAPGIVPGAWAGLVTAGAAAGITVLMILLARQGAGTGALAVAAAALLAGAAGARGWYVMLQRGKVSGPPVQGLAVQGFVVGAALAAVPGLLLAGIPAGAFAGAAAPALFFAMAVGRQGCFLAGCCAGRPTASRWGIWSSDGRVGARRIPAQHLEALACLLIGSAALAAFLRVGQPAGVPVLAGALAAWTLARQWLLALRAEPRRWHLAARSPPP